MVALNWQTYDIGVQMNEAMFGSVEDRSGYVLKPADLRSTKHILESAAEEQVLRKGKKLVKFSIEIISAQQLPRGPKERRGEENLDPYVEVEIYSADDKARGVAIANGGITAGSSSSVSGLGAPHRRRTKVVKENFFAPVWNEKMSFSIETRFESLLFVRFAVYNDEANSDKALRASYCMKLFSAAQGMCYLYFSLFFFFFCFFFIIHLVIMLFLHLVGIIFHIVLIFFFFLFSFNKGYHHLPLYDMRGEQFLFSSLFVRINLEPVTLLEHIATKSSAVETLKTAAKHVLKSSAERILNSTALDIPRRDKSNEPGAKS